MRKYKIIKINQDGKDYFGIFETITEGDSVNVLGTQPINNVFFESLEELYEFMDDFTIQILDYKMGKEEPLLEQDVNFLSWECDHADGCECEEDGEFVSYHEQTDNHQCCGGKWWESCKCKH